ncbi:MAG: GAF domain-containing protein [Holophaga sp.]|nr:GAF domain-containing protein [Holophaga sp.]
MSLGDELTELAEERQATLEIFRMQQLCVDPGELARTLLVLVRRYSGCEAVAIRLRQGPDYPYVASRGFSKDFLAAENFLCAKDEAGCLLRDAKGHPLLECMCGKVLAGRIDTALPFFTERSFFTNGTTELFASITPDHQRERSRDRCITTGYESMALIPIRLEDHVFGLFQCNDRRRNRFTPESIALLEDLAASAAHLFQLAMV